MLVHLTPCVRTYWLARQLLVGDLHWTLDKWLIGDVVCHVLPCPIVLA